MMREIGRQEAGAKNYVPRTESTLNVFWQIGEGRVRRGKQGIYKDSHTQKFLRWEEKSQ